MGSYDEHLYCLDQADGRLIWKAAANGVVALAAVVGVDGVVVTGSGDGQVYGASRAARRFYTNRVKRRERAWISRSQCGNLSVF